MDLVQETVPKAGFHWKEDHATGVGVGEGQKGNIAHLVRLPKDNKDLGW